MIKELINFTENLISDIPNIMEWKVTPSKGLHVFIDIDEKGNWINRNFEKGKDYDYYDGKNNEINLWKDCIKYQSISDYITMNKVQKFDSKQKIHSCSPFAVAFNFNFNEADMAEYGIKKWTKKDKPTEDEKLANENAMREKRILVVKERLADYQKNAVKMFFNDKVEFSKEQESFYANFESILNEISSLPEYVNLSVKDYIRISLRSVPFDKQAEFYANYLQGEIFNDEKLSFKDLGVVGFKTGFPDKKPFLKHKTAPFIKGVNYRFSREEALMLDNFGKLAKRKCLPNPLPIVIDKTELNNEVVKIFNEEATPPKYKELLERLFDKSNLSHLSNFYLINYTNTTSGLAFNDVDFVPMFQYRFKSKLTVQNLTFAGFKEELFKDEIIESLFDFERIVIKEIFNNSLVKIKDNKFTVSYFGDIDPQYISGGDVMYQMIMKYRNAIYNYIYKSSLNSITNLMFDDMLYHSILSNIQGDEIKGKLEWNNNIKKKLNIWFSLYHQFNLNQKTNNMASKVPELTSKIRSIAKGEGIIETPEEFAFGAGQIVSYLIDRSEASNKTYAMLEPYLQKVKSNHLQDAIAQTVAMYKHDIGIYKGKFEQLASNVLTDDFNTEMKPLLKFFLAGCFSPCVIYEKNNK